MDPVAFHVGRLTIRWYGVFVASGFLAGFHLVQHRADRAGVGRETGADLVFKAMIGGLLGARLLYVLQNWGEYRSNLLEIIRIDHGGLVFYGGLAGALALLFRETRRKKIAPHVLGDIFAPALPLGHAFGRAGCFLNGCCFGRPAISWYGVHYPPGSDVAAIQLRKGLLEADAVVGLPVVPIQLLSAAANVLICVGLLALEPRLKQKGQLFPIYMVAYGLLRFVIEFGRGDYERTFGPFTPAQLVCLGLVPMGLVWLIARRRTEVSPAQS